MTAAILQNRIASLEERINRAKLCYWEDDELNGDRITDGQYDVLIEELRELDSENILLTEPEYVGDSKDTVEHDTPMLSLEKVYSKEELLKWCDKVARDNNERYAISPKYDGMAGCHYKEKGILASRGDGYKGENLTDKIPLINFEQEEKSKTFGKSQQKIYGEILIKKSDFKSCTLTRKNGDPFKTERNLVAGVMNPSRKDMDEIKDKVQLTFVQHNSQTRVCTKDVIASTWDTIVENIESIDYPIDGIVIKLYDIAYGKTLGATSHHPRHSVAFKFPDEKHWANIISIDWQVGKRKITPVVYIEPTEIDGVTVKKATLHNAKNVLDMDIQEGDMVSIVRRGGVIPYIESSKPGKTRKRPILEKCPSCQEPVFYDEPELVCKNTDCDGSIKKKLTTAAKILEIDGLSDGTISKIVEYFQGEVISVADLLRLRYDDFIELDGFADKSSQKLEDNILVVTQGVEDWKILASLSLEGIGRTLSKQLLARVNLAELRNLVEDDLYDFDNMGPERIEVLVSGLYDSSNIIDDIISQGVNIVETKVKRNSVITQADIKKTICFSGSFPKAKRFYQQLARDNGLVVTDSVTRKLDYLVTAGASTSKVKKARNYKITILEANDFINKVSKL
jgi:DNA ligase (NAD+)